MNSNKNLHQLVNLEEKETFEFVDVRVNNQKNNRISVPTDNVSGTNAKPNIDHYSIDGYTLINSNITVTDFEGISPESKYNTWLSGDISNLSDCKRAVDFSICNNISGKLGSVQYSTYTYLKSSIPNQFCHMSSPLRGDELL